MIKVICMLMSLMLLFLSCGAPFYYERAKIYEGFSGGIGVGVGTGFAMSSDASTELDFHPHADYCIAGLASFFLRYGFSENISMFSQLNAGAGHWLNPDVSDEEKAIPFDGQIGLKFRTGKNGAIKLCVGVPTLFDVVYLEDNSDFMTSNIGVGFRGITGGVTLHPKISKRVLGHISLNGLWTPWALVVDTPLYQSFSGSIGFGIEDPTTE